MQFIAVINPHRCGLIRKSCGGCDNQSSRARAHGERWFPHKIPLLRHGKWARLSRLATLGAARLLGGRTRIAPVLAPVVVARRFDATGFGARLTTLGAARLLDLLSRIVVAKRRTIGLKEGLGDLVRRGRLFGFLDPDRNLSGLRLELRRTASDILPPSLILQSTTQQRKLGQQLTPPLEVLSHWTIIVSVADHPPVIVFPSIVRRRSFDRIEKDLDRVELAGSAGPGIILEVADLLRGLELLEHQPELLRVAQVPLTSRRFPELLAPFRRTGHGLCQGGGRIAHQRAEGEEEGEEEGEREVKKALHGVSWCPAGGRLVLK